MAEKEETLYKQTEEDSPDAFRRLYDMYWLQLYRYACNILRDDSQCQDIVQEVFCDLWRRRAANKIQFVRAYLYRATKFQILKLLRDGKTTQEHKQQFAKTQEQFFIHDAEPVAIDYNELSDAIQQLPEKCQEIFNLRWNDNLSQEEIAERLGVSKYTVKNQIAKALDKLSKSIRVKLNS